MVIMFVMYTKKKQILISYTDICTCVGVGVCVCVCVNEILSETVTDLLVTIIYMLFVVAHGVRRLVRFDGEGVGGADK